MHKKPFVKSLFIKSYGCQMNVYDSARMADVLEAGGYSAAETAEAADLIIVNTCHIRERAAEKVYSELGRLRELKAARAGSARPLRLAVAGCVAQAEGDEIFRRVPEVDLIVGPQAYHRLADLVGELDQNGSRRRTITDTEFPVESKFDFLPPPRALGASAFLTVQEGCDKFCSFCVVPYTRGAEWSRPGYAILDEAAKLTGQGVREITLLGQNVNAYHGHAPDGEIWSLGRLLRELAALDGLQRLRYTTSHPLEMDDELIGAHGNLEKLMPFLHLPVQSGSDRVLAAMKRRHSAADYLRIVGRLRRVRSDIALSSDFIVGFPGETDNDFKATLALVREVGFAQSYAFKFSPRPGTPAAAMADQVSDPVKSERLAALQSELNVHQLAFNRLTVGRTVEVLFDRPGRGQGRGVGRSPYMQAVQLEGETQLAHTLAAVTIIAANPHSVTGRLADPPGTASNPSVRH